MKHVLRFVSLAFVVNASACGGGGSAAVPAPAVSTAPAASPTPGASATPQASLTAITFATNAAVTFTVAETGYTGTFSETDTCAPLTGTIATVTPASGTASYTVTPIGAGSCSITVKDASGGSVTLPVTVSALAVTVQ